jgi:hypothetical protein
VPLTVCRSSLTLHPPTLLARSYQDAGPKGPSEFDSGVAGFEARAFRGLGIFTSTP